MSGVSLSSFLGQHTPILVTSPVIRSGTTLVQRLLCSSRNALVFGQACGQELEFFLNLYTSKALMYRYSRRQADLRLESFSDGEVNDWILDLMPSLDGFLSALGHSAFSWLDFLRDFAARAGRPVWGIKYPGWTPPVLSLLREAMPRCRLIYVHRDLASCLRSARAFGAVRWHDEAHTFCDHWVRNLGFARRLEGQEGVFLLSYSDLLQRGEETLARLAAFTGAEGIRPDVLQRRISTAPEAGSATGGAYVKPSPLTEEEEKLVREAEIALGGDP